MGPLIFFINQLVLLIVKRYNNVIGVINSPKNRTYTRYFGSKMVLIFIFFGIAKCPVLYSSGSGAGIPEGESRDVQDNQEVRGLQTF